MRDILDVTLYLLYQNLYLALGSKGVNFITTLDRIAGLDANQAWLAKSVELIPEP